jgi:hypothetical protein
VALPLLDAMLPAGGVSAYTKAPGRARFVCIENVHGAAGSTDFGMRENLWSPAGVGADFDLSAGSLQPLKPFREYLTIVSNTDVAMAEAYTPAEIGGDHFRASAVFLTQSHPKQTQGSDVRAGISIDQLYAQRFCQDTPIPSMQLCIENVDQAGGCEYGYSCVYMDMISWASENEPLPMIQDPRAVFDQLFGLGATPEERRRRRREDRSVLDTVTAAISRLKQDLGATDRARIDDYLEDVREIERRIQKIEAFNSSGEERELPHAPVGVPDSFDDHVKLMFDLQAIAFASDITRVFSFKFARDVSGRVYPPTGVTTGFHNASHHNENEERIRQFERINRYHVSLVPYFLAKLKSIQDGDATLLDNTVVMYGSPMGNPNFHNHKRCPLFFAGKGAGALRGGLHLKAPSGTPMANVFLTLLHNMGMDDLQSFGDSTGEFNLTSAPSQTTAAD